MHNFNIKITIILNLKDVFVILQLNYIQGLINRTKQENYIMWSLIVYMGYQTFPSKHV